MFTSFPVYDPRCARPLCDATFWLRQPDAIHKIADQLAADGVPVSGVQFLPETTLLPNRAYVTSGPDLFVFLDGTSSLSQLQQIILGYTLDSFGTGRAVYNGAVAAAGAGIVSELSAFIITRPSRVYLVGWSFGGAIAQFISSPINWLWLPIDKINVCTFGAPKWGGLAFAQVLAGINNIGRWMNAEDVIPLVPPNPNQAGVFALTLGVRTAIRMGNFVHTCDGLNLPDVGEITESNLPTAAAFNVIGSLALMIKSWVDDRAGAHSLTQYSDRLSTAEDFSTQQFRTPAKISEQPVILQNQEVVANVHAIRGNFRIQEQAQHAVAPVIPSTMGFRVVREKPFWTVYFGKDAISLHTNKHSARAFARNGNAFLASGLHSGSVDAEGLVSELSAFFAASKDPGSGIKPPVQENAPAM